ncbi:MAG: hypothetical protein GY771_04905 [bacterium]|nr:hypothetical protein [bacterium]
MAKPKLAYMRGNAETRRIRKEGRPAKAVVVAIAESDVGENDLPDGFENMTLTLEIDDGVRSPYLVSIESIVPYSVTAQYQPGAEINVKVDNDDPEIVAIIS